MHTGTNVGTVGDLESVESLDTVCGLDDEAVQGAWQRDEQPWRLRYPMCRPVNPIALATSV